MFWMALVFLSLSWVLTKFGVLSATVSFLTIAIKLLLVLGLLGMLVAVFFFWRRKRP